MRFLFRLLINAAALWVASAIVPGIQREGDWGALLLVALVFGVLNAIIRPILALLSCPLADPNPGPVHLGSERRHADADKRSFTKVGPGVLRERLRARAPGRTRHQRRQHCVIDVCEG